MKNNVSAWLLAMRPKTLTAALAPVIAASALVAYHGFTLDYAAILCALVASFCIQIGTNLVNDASDFKKGADNEHRIGPQRVTQQGVFTYEQVMLMATIFFGLAIAFGIPLVIQGGWPIAILGLASVLLGYLYTMGKYSLAYTGLGDLFVILFFGIGAVGGLYYILTGVYTEDAFILGLQIGFLSTVLIAINNLRDIETDKASNKKTLATRLGVKWAKYWIVFLIAAPFLVGYHWILNGDNYLYMLPVFSLPLGLMIIKKILKTEPSVAYNKFLGMASLYALLFSVLFAIGTRIHENLLLQI